MVGNELKNQFILIYS